MYVMLSIWSRQQDFIEKWNFQNTKDKQISIDELIMPMDATKIKLKNNLCNRLLIVLIELGVNTPV